MNTDPTFKETLDGMIADVKAARLKFAQTETEVSRLIELCDYAQEARDAAQVQLDLTERRLLTLLVP